MAGDIRRVEAYLRTVHVSTVNQIRAACAEDGQGSRCVTSWGNQVMEVMSALGLVRAVKQGVYQHATSPAPDRCRITATVEVNARSWRHVVEALESLADQIDVDISHGAKDRSETCQSYAYTLRVLRDDSDRPAPKVEEEMTHE